MIATPEAKAALFARTGAVAADMESSAILAVAAAAVAAFLAVDRVEVTRMTKNGLRTFDARGAVVALEAGPGGSDDDALAELKSKMGLLEAPKGDSAKQLQAGAAGGATAGADVAHKSEDKSGPTGPSLSAEDLKELEDLDLSDVEGSKSSSDKKPS